MERADTAGPFCTGPSLPARRRWNRFEFERAGEMGIFRPDERLELIEGEIVEKMVPQNSPHATAIRCVEEALRLAFPRGHDVRVQLPLALDDASEPEPDLAVVVGGFRDFALDHPRSAVLIVEVADTTLAYDRRIKATLYARAGVTDYWIVNLSNRTIEVYRDPAQTNEQPSGYQFQTVASHLPGASVSPLASPEVRIPVADLLP